jgi:hypothetical protein
MAEKRAMVPVMKRDNEGSKGIRPPNKHQHGWEHIPGGDNEEAVPPNSYLSSTSTAYDPSQFQKTPQHDPRNFGNASVIIRKESQVRCEEELFNAEPRLERRRFLSEWWKEMLSAASSVFCLVAIVVILCVVDEKPLSDWDEPVSLNAVISILSTAVKAGLILPVAECISQLKWIHLQGSSKSQ